MKPGAIASAEKKISPMAQISEESGGAFLAFQGAVKGLKVDVVGFFAGMASNVVPALQSVVEGLGYAIRWLNGVLADAGKLIGGGLAFWITAMKEGFSGILSGVVAVFGGIVLLLMNTINSGIAAIYAAFDAIKGKLGFGKSVTIAPQLDTTNVESNLENILKPINDRVAAQQEEAAAKKTPDPGGLELAPKAAAGIPQLITSSFTKVGATGGATWGMDQGLTVQRDQLTVQQRIANSIDAFLKAAQQPNNPLIGGVTPQLGVI